MPMHDWKRVDAGIFHAFHHEWISEIGRALNRGLLPNDLYALPEQVAGGFGPDVLALQERTSALPESGSVAVMPMPKARFVAESDTEFFLRKKSSIAIRHVSGDRIVAMVEIVSPGNKSTRDAFHAFVAKASELLEHRVHLLILDPHPPTRRDPEGVHAAIWSGVDEEGFQLPADKRLTFVSYACGLTTKAFIEPIAVGDILPDMPLFYEPNGYVNVPLESTYTAAFAEMPRRWRDVLEPPTA